MTARSFVSRAAIASTVFALAALLSAVAALAAVRVPRVATGSVSHVRGSSAELAGSVNPNGSPTTYFFQYGPTLAYGHQSAPTAVGAGTTSVKVGQAVTGFLPGYHYRIVATNAVGSAVGHDKLYSISKGRLRFALERTKPAPTPYGGTFLLRGTLTGGALHTVLAQSSPFPFLSPFVNVGLPILTNAAGAFAIPITNLKQSTQLRVTTTDARPLISPIVEVHVSVRVTLKVRFSSHKGLVRLYGTVTPARVGATVLFQVLRPVRPRPKSEEETESRFTTQSKATVKRATRSFSRFSHVFTVRRGGQYRAYVQLRSGGPLASGFSSTVTLHAAPASALHKGG
jgi:hypothetical protein